jgi:hypothetical protein
MFFLVILDLFVYFFEFAQLIQCRDTWVSISTIIGRKVKEFVEERDYFNLLPIEVYDSPATILIDLNRELLLAVRSLEL